MSILTLQDTIEHDGVTLNDGVTAFVRSRGWSETFQPLYWLAIPFLALLAYASALRIDLLGDDLWLLNEARNSGVTLQTLVPSHDWVFYRPLGTLFTWQIGWQLWGLNPLPYHLIGLLAHAAASLVLGLWLADITGRRLLGWLAGALFAVFPLHIEALGWTATQWDIWT
ncbi:MAG: hypothetical protein M3014_12190, partial [Chloroflexota bacterium]|nr:hypothetical protein [Chloroflexota bacterium]